MRDALELAALLALMALVMGFVGSKSCTEYQIKSGLETDYRFPYCHINIGGEWMTVSDYKEGLAK